MSILTEDVEYFDGQIAVIGQAILNIETRCNTILKDEGSDDDVKAVRAAALDVAPHAEAIIEPLRRMKAKAVVG